MAGRALGYPGSLTVAIAIAQAKDQGVLAPQDPSRAPFAYRQAVRRINHFAVSLSGKKLNRNKNLSTMTLQKIILSSLYFVVKKQDTLYPIQIHLLHVG